VLQETQVGATARGPSNAKRSQDQREACRERIQVGSVMERLGATEGTTDARVR
jgi:hypothetical protein